MTNAEYEYKTNAEYKRGVQAAVVAVCVVAFVIACAAGVFWDYMLCGKDDGGVFVTEQVERKTWRIEKRHDGCPVGGFWRAYGTPQKIEAYGIDKFTWPHKCSGCGETNSFYDVRYPKFSNEWVRVRK